MSNLLLFWSAALFRRFVLLCLSFVEIRKKKSGGKAPHSKIGKKAAEKRRTPKKREWYRVSFAELLMLDTESMAIMF